MALQGMDNEAYYGEESQQEHDKEWEDFEKLLEEKRKNSSQMFYPCPASEDVEDYVQTLVSILINFVHTF